MKTIIIRSIGLSLSAMIMAMHPFAQQKSDHNNVTAYNVDENILPSSDKSSPMNVAGSLPENKIVLKHFNKMFLNASNVSWTLERNGRENVYFTKDGFANSVLFDKKGNIIYLINYVSEKQLPADVKTLIENNYEEFKITSVDKVIQSNQTIWVVKLASVFHFITLSVEDGEMKEIEKFSNRD